MPTNHIVTAFDQDLRGISGRISEMGGLAEEQLGHAIEALRERDSELAREIIRIDKRLGQLFVRLFQLGELFMHSYRPLANSL